MTTNTLTLTINQGLKPNDFGRAKDAIKHDYHGTYNPADKTWTINLDLDTAAVRVGRRTWGEDLTTAEVILSDLNLQGAVTVIKHSELGA